MTRKGRRGNPLVKGVALLLGLVGVLMLLNVLHLVQLPGASVFGTQALDTLTVVNQFAGLIVAVLAIVFYVKSRGKVF